ncbi:hypothetical protein ASD8599_01388 [Ascidiaceihabitans donghaensis]|uniref:Uncharacterized protein n=1 Tax=Ascidiaceihabitans donghaensis TaxID=1510460 RepID=A0A2R8BC55_9RHOB|nr:hypothetical protein [Ascidiaceihabitans donghaensis]SPH20649.1 hypothetical protein ASD8599_01388 [Ascidiaceihabitans donghaensis]
MGALVKWVIGGAIVVGIGFWVAKGVERQNVRDCLAEQSQRYGIAQGHDVYLTDVIEVNIHRSYPDGTATRFVKYLVQGSQNLQSTTCLW